MTQEEQLLDLLRKLDPATGEEPKKKGPSAESPETNIPKATMDKQPDPAKAGQAAVSNDTADKLNREGGTGKGVQTAGSVAQDRYAQTATHANPDKDRNVINDSRWENWNDRSYNDTINLSRLANAFNAQRTWFAPTLKPMSRGGEGGGYNLNIVQNPQLNTLEQQATGIAAQGAAQRQSQDITRQGRSYDLPLTIEEAVARGVVDRGVQQDMIRLGLSQQMMQNIWDNMYNKEYSQNLAERMQQFIADLQQQEIGENGQRLLAQFAQDPTLAIITAQFWNTQMPSFSTWIQNGAIMNQLRQRGVDPYSMQAQQDYDTASLLWAMNHLNNTTAGMTGMLGAGIAGINTKVSNGGLFAPKEN